MKTEAEIRDYLASNLHLIEADLQLVSTEYTLKNNESIVGYVDILAKDRFNNLVIIEIKKDKNPARQAIHELHKYVALVKQIHKVQDGKIRCILVSKEWKELLTPFSNFVHRTPSFQIEGFKIIIDSPEKSVKCERVSIIPKEKISDNIEFSLHHLIVLFANESNRDKAEEPLKRIIENLETPIVVFSIVYKGDNEEVIFPFGFYIAPLIVEPEKRIVLEKELDLEIDEELASNDEWYFEQEILSYISKEMLPFSDNGEAGYAEKLHAIIQKQWIIDKTLRFGREISSEEIYSDEDLLNQVKGFEGRNSALYQVQGSPKYSVRWQEIKKELSYTLIGNPEWENAVELYFQEIEKFHNEADITIAIYNPCNTIITLSRFFEGNLLYLPTLRIEVKEPDRTKTFFGSLFWNGKPISETPEQIIDSVYEDMNDFLYHLHFGETYIQDHKMLSKHNLLYDFVEAIEVNNIIVDMKRIILQDNQILRVTSEEAETFSLPEFASKNSNYLQALHNYISFFIHGF